MHEKHKLTQKLHYDASHYGVEFKVGSYVLWHVLSTNAQRATGISGLCFNLWFVVLNQAVSFSFLFFTLGDGVHQC